MKLTPYGCMLIGLGILSIISVPIPPILVPSTGIAFIGIIATVIGLCSKRLIINRLLSSIMLFYFLLIFVLFGLQTAAFANAAREKTCRSNMRIIYYDQIYHSDRYAIKVGKGIETNIIDNDSVIPNTIRKIKNGRYNFCKHYYFSLLFKKRYYAINI